MLLALSVRNIILIESLDLEFGPGLWALTGETGAGKSILLDSLGLALGGRADRSIIRPQATEGSVTAQFSVSGDHLAARAMAALGLPFEGEIILRRQLKSDGRTRAWINDQAVSVTALRSVGETLLEIHGQHDERGILSPKSHRLFLDLFGGYEAELGRCRRSYERFRDIESQIDEHREALRNTAEEREYLQHAYEELIALNPKPGEENELSTARVSMMNAEQIGKDLISAGDLMSGQNGVEAQMSTVAHLVSKSSLAGPPVIKELSESIEKSLSDVAEIGRAISLLQRHLRYDEDELNRIEERLFSLRAAARKFKATPDTLLAVLEAVKEKLNAIETGDERLAELEKKHEEARLAYEKVAVLLTKKRQSAAGRFDRKIARELAPLKLEKAKFSTRIETLSLDDSAGWSADGLERVEFQVATNPDSPPGPISDVASGGEFARFVLAMKVVQASSAGVDSLVFDEVDQGVGGAVADAVGERLLKISESSQVLVVTHSPQVASRATAQLLVAKHAATDNRTSVNVHQLDTEQRVEEIARMLSGARITDAARRAAKSLLSAAEPLKTGTGG